MWVGVDFGLDLRSSVFSCAQDLPPWGVAEALGAGGFGVFSAGCWCRWSSFFLLSEVDCGLAGCLSAEADSVLVRRVSWAGVLDSTRLGGEVFRGVFDGPAEGDLCLE